MKALILTILTILLCIVLLYLKSEEDDIPEYIEVFTIDRVRNLQDTPGILFVDVRQQQEVRDTGRIPESINIPLNNLKYVLEELSDQDFNAIYGRDRPNLYTIIVFSGKSEKGGKQAMKIARGLGYRNVKFYPGGWTEWNLENESFE